MRRRPFPDQEHDTKRFRYGDLGSEAPASVGSSATQILHWKSRLLRRTLFIFIAANLVCRVTSGLSAAESNGLAGIKAIHWSNLCTRPEAPDSIEVKAARAS